MPLSNLLRTAAGTCRYGGNKAGLIARDHPECRRTYDAGFQEMVNLGADAARTYAFDEKSLSLTLAAIAKRSYGNGSIVNQALEEGWKLGVAHSMADGILTQVEETNLREFRDRLALADSGADQKAVSQLEKAFTDRLTLDTRPAALAVETQETPDRLNAKMG